MRKIQQTLKLSLAVLSITSAFAQTPPDAGALQQQLERERVAPLPRRLAPDAQAQPAPMKPVAGITVTVQSFNFVGNHLLTAEQLAAAVAPYLHRPLDFGQLQAAAASVARAYRAAGWVVRAYLPAQDVMSGTVTIQIVESIFGGANMESGAKRISQEQIQKIIAAKQKKGAPLNADAIDQALLLADDLPGVRVSGALRAGTREGETDLMIRLQDEDLLQTDLNLDNTGSRSTGSARLNASLNVLSPLHRGDLLSASLMRSEGSTYLRAGYTLPVGGSGWRLGGSVSQLDYSLVGADFSALDARGSSKTLGLESNFPLLRTRTKNAYLAVNLDHKAFDNKALGATTSHYTSDALTIGLNGNSFDNLAGGGSNSLSLSWINGSIDLGTLDKSESTTLDGGFSKFRYSLSRQQAINTDWSISASLSGQESDETLDSSEKFYLGGANGVRAYPSSEGSGSSGHLLSLELRWRLPRGMILSGFHDQGRVRNDAGVPSYNLKGVGLALAWRGESGLNLKGTWAHRIGDNPNPTATGQDQDGSLDKNRIWLSAGLSF